VREAVEILGAERIGHGIAVMNDPALAESLATRGVVLENCPSSNLCTGALCKADRKARGIARRPSASPISRARPGHDALHGRPGPFHTDLLTNIREPRRWAFLTSSSFNSPSKASTRLFYRRSTSENISRILATRQKRAACYNFVAVTMTARQSKLRAASYNLR